MADTKRCSGCKDEKPLSEFNKYGASKDGLHYYCRSCQSLVNKRTYAKHREDRVRKVREYYNHPDRREARAAYMREYHKEYHAKIRDHHYRQKYGISLEEYNAILLRQNGVCAICQTLKKGRRLAVDHCHTTGRVRGLICARCNYGLGVFHDDPAYLQRAIVYLNQNLA